MLTPFIQNNKTKILSELNKPKKHRLFRFLMKRMGSTKPTILFKRQLIWRFSFILR